VQYSLVACVVLAGCFSSTAPKPQHPTEVIPAPKVLRPLPLKAGQWARYRERDAHGDLGEARFVAVATSFCGTWVRVELSDRRRTRTWLVCVRDAGSTPRAHITRALLDDGSGDPREVDPANAAELDALATRIVAPDLAAAFERDDVTVPAGTFEEASRAQDGASTTWLHPLVPFSGAVKVADRDGREDVLEDFGDTAVDVPDQFRAGAHAKHRRLPFVAAGLGYSVGSGKDDVIERGSRLATIGWHVTGQLDVVAMAAAISSHRSTPATTISDDVRVDAIGGGVRWCPLRRAPNEGIALEPYVQAVVGYSETPAAIRGTDYGPAAIATAGWLAGRSGDWGVAAQVDLLAAGYNSRRVSAASLDLLLQLELR
jgi:hypothetical protein